MGAANGAIMVRCVADNCDLSRAGISANQRQRACRGDTACGGKRVRCGHALSIRPGVGVDSAGHDARGRLILAGDIGATNARFGCYEGGEQVGSAELATADFASADSLLADAVAALPPGSFDVCCLAVAGPVFATDGDETAQLTNAGLAFSRRGVAAAVPARKALLVNDMVAIGTAVDRLPGDRFETLRQGVRRANPVGVGGVGGVGGAKGVLAAGTGLGMGVVVEGRCLPSEGGHARIAPVGGFERELVAVTEAERAAEGGIVTWEHYLSGSGVATLHRAVSAVWGAPAPTLAAREVVRRGLAGDDPVCETTVRTWAGMFATAAAGLAVAALTFGGVYLAGSVAAAVAPALREAHFQRRFAEGAGAAELLADIPLLLTADARIGVEGAHLLARAAVS